MLGVYIEGKVTPNDEMSTAAVVNTICAARPDAVVIHTYRGSKARRLFDVPESRLLFYDISQCESWREQYKLAKKLLEENGIDTLIVYKNIIIKGQKNGDMSQIERFIRKRKLDDRCYMSFAMSKAQYSKYLMVEAGNFVCNKVYEFLLDPQEPHWGDLYTPDRFKYLYGMQRSGRYIYMPCFEYGVQRLTAGMNMLKMYDFTFFCSCLTKDREFILEYKQVLESIPNSNVRINQSKMKPMPQRSYYELVAQSKFSMCIPAYDKSAFSMYRLIEALVVDCICFIHKDCCLTDVENTFPDIYKLICDHGLIVGFEDVPERIKRLTDNDRYDIINNIKNTKSWRQFSDLGFIERRWSKI